MSENPETPTGGYVREVLVVGKNHTDTFPLPEGFTPPEGVTVNVTIHTHSTDNARAAADAFMQKLKELRRKD